MEAELEKQDYIDKCRRFAEWAAKNGIKMPKLEYPAFFQGGLLGVKIKEDINHNEAFLSVPLACILSVDKAKQIKELNEIYKAHPDLFDEEESDDWEHHIIEVFILYEMQKGEKSFWYPYF